MPKGMTCFLFSPSGYSNLTTTGRHYFNVEYSDKGAMDVKERKPYRSLTRRRDTERRYTSSSAESEDSKAPQKSYSSSETLKAYDQDSRLTYSNRVKDMVHQEADEFCRAGGYFSADAAVSSMRESAESLSWVGGISLKTLRPKAR